MLNTIDQKDLDLANEVIKTLNEEKKATRKLSELTPVALLLIHNSMKQLNCGHMHYMRNTVRVNGQEYKMTDMDMDHMQLFPESKNGDYYVQVYGWNHYGDESGIYFHVKGAVACFCNPITPDFRNKYTFNNPFAPKSPNGFIDFNWNKIDREKSSISFWLYDEDDYVSVALDITANCESAEDVIYETEKLP